MGDCIKGEMALMLFGGGRKVIKPVWNVVVERKKLCLLALKSELSLFFSAIFFSNFELDCLKKVFGRCHFMRLLMPPAMKIFLKLCLLNGTPIKVCYSDEL